jgi:hypothetical protein
MSTLAERPAVTAADRARSPSVHVFALPEGYAVADAPAPASAPNYVKRGSTANFVVYYDTAVATGATLADAILSSCEWEYAMMKGWFGGITPASLPFTIYIDVGSFGAYHANCLATEIHCGAAAGNNSDLVRMLMAAEMDEVFMAAQNKGWNCGYSHGEGLSRVLATELYPAQLNGFASAPTWLDGTRPNWIDNTETTDRDYTSVGCATLFLNFLRYELTYSWNDIVAAAAPTLAGVYKNLTGAADAWTRFSAFVQAHYPQGTPSGLVNDNPFAFGRHGGSLLQGRFGNVGNFEAVVTASSGGLAHLWRNNDASGLPWSSPIHFGAALGASEGATVIQSNFMAPGLAGNLEVAAVDSSGGLNHLWRDPGPAFAWSAPFQFATGATGKPSMIQSHFGSKGNFELVVAQRSGGLAHYWRNNDAANLPWSGATAFGQTLGQIDAVALIESNYGNPGNLEVVARVGSTLYAFWRGSSWSAPLQIATGVAGQPCFIQSRFGTRGNFELVVPSATGGLIHMWRNNDATSLPWSGPTPFGSGTFSDVGLIESNYGEPGNLEVLARQGNSLSHFWRDSAWHGPIAVAGTV